MTEINEDNIRVAAYYIWEQAGRPEGAEKECWLPSLKKNRLKKAKANLPPSRPKRLPKNRLQKKRRLNRLPSLPQPQRRFTVLKRNKTLYMAFVGEAMPPLFYWK